MDSLTGTFARSEGDAGDDLDVDMGGPSASSLFGDFCEGDLGGAGELKKFDCWSLFGNLDSISSDVVRLGGGGDIGG